LSLNAITCRYNQYVNHKISGQNFDDDERDSYEDDSYSSYGAAPGHDYSDDHSDDQDDDSGWYLSAVDKDDDDGRWANSREHPEENFWYKSGDKDDGRPYVTPT
tara:strand:+ start:4675 stop:4986 length:312 start_codon:yes stop_codon:yes gene_type:complete